HRAGPGSRRAHGFLPPRPPIAWPGAGGGRPCPSPCRSLAPLGTPAPLPSPPSSPPPPRLASAPFAPPRTTPQGASFLAAIGPAEGAGDWRSGSVVRQNEEGPREWHLGGPEFPVRTGSG